MGLRKTWIICLMIPLAVGGLAAWLTMGSIEQFASRRDGYSPWRGPRFIC